MILYSPTSRSCTLPAKIVNARSRWACRSPPFERHHASNSPNSTIPDWSTSMVASAIFRPRPACVKMGSNESKHRRTTVDQQQSYAPASRSVPPCTAAPARSRQATRCRRRRSGQTTPWLSSSREMSRTREAARTSAASSACSCPT